MKNTILYLEETIEEVASEATRNTKHITDNKRDIEENQKTITELSLHGQWCGDQDAWTTTSSVIRYDSMFVHR